MWGLALIASQKSNLILRAFCVISFKMFHGKLDTRWRALRPEKKKAHAQMFQTSSPPVSLYIHFQRVSFMKSLCGQLFSQKADLVLLTLLAYLYTQGRLWQNHIMISLHMRHIAAAQSRFYFVFIVGTAAYLGGLHADLFRGFCCLVSLTGSICTLSRLLVFF